MPRRNSFHIISKIFLALLWAGLSQQGHAIRGGFDATGIEWSSVVGIKDCSGVMIHERILVTAAHCLADWRPNERWLWVQESSRYPSAEVEVEIENFKLHPAWLRSPGKAASHDLAYVILKKPLPWRVQIYPLARELLPDPGHKIVALGLGPDRMLEKGYRGEARYYRSRRRGFALKWVQDLGALQIFAPRIVGESACHSDSGGPVFAENSSGERSLIGLLVGISDRCDAPGQKQIIQPINVDSQFWSEMWEKVK